MLLKRIYLPVPLAIYMIPINHTKVPEQMSSGTDRTTINPMIENLNRQLCFREHIFEHFNIDDYGGFLEKVSITFIDKTDLSDLEKQEN